jgi:hypothetical protein
MQTSEKRYFDLAAYFRGVFGQRVQKITIDAGLTCPNRDGTTGSGGCIYCNARGSGTGAHKKGLSIPAQLEAGKARLARRYKADAFIAYFQSYTNTYAPLETLRRMWTEALATPKIVGLSIGTRPDCVDSSVLDLAAAFAEKTHLWMEYGLQSAFDETLKRIGRGHDFACFERAVAESRKRGIRVLAHLILGLPGETPEMMRKTAEIVGAMGLDGAKIHLLYVVRGTRLETFYRAGHYRCLTRSEYVDIVCDVLERLSPQTVIHRLTGDPHPHELIAPAWSLEKNQTLSMIKETLVCRESRQGALAANRFAATQNGVSYIGN